MTDKKDKNINNVEEENEELDEDNLILEEDITEDNIEEMIKKITEENGSKPITIRISHTIFNNFFLEFIVELIISLLLFISIHYLIKPFESNLIVDICLFGGSWSLNYIINYFLKKKFIGLYLFTIGLIEIVIFGIIYGTALSILVGKLIITMNSVFYTILSFILSYGVSKFVIRYISNKVDNIKKEKKNE